MSKSDPLNRRAFLRNVPISAFAGAALAAEAGNAEAGGSGKYDFDTPYSRLGTDSIKWDRQRACRPRRAVAPAPRSGGLGSAPF